MSKEKGDYAFHSTPMGKASLEHLAKQSADMLGDVEIKGVQLRGSRKRDHTVADGIVTRSKAGVSGVPVDVYVEQHSKKRLVQTSPPYPTQTEALEAAYGLSKDDFCDYVYVTEDNRTVGIFDYYDVTPAEPVKPGQRRVRIPNFNSDRQED